SLPAEETRGAISATSYEILLGSSVCIPQTSPSEHTHRWLPSMIAVFSGAYRTIFPGVPRFRESLYREVCRLHPNMPEGCTLRLPKWGAAMKVSTKTEVLAGRGQPHMRQDKPGFPLITYRYAAIGMPSCWLA